MIQRILLTTALLILFGAAAVSAQSTPTQVQKKVSDALGVEGKAQEKADKLNADRSGMLEEIRNVKYKIAWLDYRQKQYNVYVNSVKENIANLEFQKTEILTLREQLEPYLDEVINRMEQFIDNDLTFNTEERTKRIENLRDTINNYEVSMSEKLRMVLAEGLQIEADYGKQLETDETQINIDGEDVQVTTFRLGRVGMFYRNLDGTETGRWNEDAQKWEKVPEELNRSIRRAVSIASGERTVELVDLPLGVIE
ncbi:MAG: DUF3450 domain-containing protein [Deltaproteobacteria bacterium]|nr:DUF3450 domain-containing protein [Deltaproteobacteria bacterium]